MVKNGGVYDHNKGKDYGVLNDLSIGAISTACYADNANGGNVSGGQPAVSDDQSSSDRESTHGGMAIGESMGIISAVVSLKI